MPPHPLNLRNLDASGMTEALASYGVDTAVAGRIFARVHRDGSSLLDNVRGLSAFARQRIAAGTVWPDLEVVERRRSEDGFVKYLFRLHDGHEIEAVRIPLPDPAAARALKDRRRAGLAGSLEPLPTAKYTVCVSSQAGCALACDFCATGRLGGIRSLETWEILAQITKISSAADHPVRGVVFMGMGEPFLNYDNVIRAARILSNPAGPAIAAKAISISTAGVVPMIRRFTSEGHHFRMIVSLGAPSSDLRARLMPIERRWPLAELMPAVKDYGEAAGGRVTLAYVAIAGINTSAAQAQQLAELVKASGARVKINLIDVSDPAGRYLPPSAEELRCFRDVLAGHNIPTVRRYSGGGDIGAACGRLAATREGGQLLQISRSAG